MAPVWVLFAFGSAGFGGVTAILATAGSWLCYYKALQDGPASVVAPIDKLSILVTVGFSWWFLKEKVTPLALVGLGLITVGTLTMLV